MPTPAADFTLDAVRPLAAQEFDEIRRLAYRAFGLDLKPGKEELVSARLPDLPRDVRELLLVVSALPRPTIENVEEAVGSALDVTEALRVAEDARVLQTEREHVRFTHPLLASAVYASVSGSQRREVHRRLAQVVTDPEERARHVAAALNDPDESAASEIEAGIGFGVSSSPSSGSMMRKCTK